MILDIKIDFVKALLDNVMTLVDFSVLLCLDALCFCRSVAIT